MEGALRRYSVLSEGATILVQVRVRSPSQIASFGLEGVVWVHIVRALDAKTCRSEGREGFPALFITFELQQGHAHPFRFHV